MRSKHLILMAFFLLVIPATTTPVAADSVALDGHWWSGLTDLQQVLCIEAAVGAYEQGYNNGYISASNKDNRDFHSTRTIDQLVRDPDLK
jgi:hypothetical protein